MHATTTYAVDAVLAFFLIIASVIGAQLGVLAANKLRGEEIRALLAIIVLGVATKIALDLLVEPNEIFNISIIVVSNAMRAFEYKKMVFNYL